MYRALDAKKVTETVHKLGLRISERFPSSGLLKVCRELELVSQEAYKKVVFIEKPLIFLRIGIGLLVLFAVVGIVASIYALPVQWSKFNVGEIVQILEASTNELVLIGAAMFFLFTIEARVKRARALKALYELRSIAHVIDMHQLTKDPSRDIGNNTQSSPKVVLTTFEMVRYLDYCSEMLSLVGKIAALFAQASQDEVILNTINEIESLTSNLSFEVWQKIAIISADNEKQESQKKTEKMPEITELVKPEAEKVETQAAPEVILPEKPKSSKKGEKEKKSKKGKGKKEKKNGAESRKESVPVADVPANSPQSMATPEPPAA